MTERDPSLTGVTERILDVAQKEKVSIEDMVDAIGQRSLLPLLFAPAFLAATPLSGIPGVSVVCGLMIAIISVELLLNFNTVRLPGKLMRRSVDGDALRKVVRKAQPVVSWIDRHTRNRLSGLFHRPLIYVPQLLCLVSGLAMPFLEFIPFSSSIVATGVCLLSLALLTRDGLLFLLAMIPYAGIVAVVTYTLG